MPSASCDFPVRIVSAPNKMTYFSTDGSYLRLEFYADADSDFENNRWVLSFPNGTRVEELPGQYQRIYDRNDNYVTITETYDEYQQQLETRITDQMGRSIWVDYEITQPWVDSVHSRGFANQTEIVWEIRWREVYVCEYYLDSEDHFGTSRHHRLRRGGLGF
ncbi:MAG: hypothetical protein ACE15E_05235 [Acidobacteriota bacterium]